MKPNESSLDAGGRRHHAHRAVCSPLRECLRLGDFTDCLLDAYDSVARRAYQKYLDRGAVPGGHLDDWLCAEHDLFEVPVDFEESGEFIYALASVPGFTGVEISVAVDPFCLLILAQRNASPTSRLGEPGCGTGTPTDNLFSVFELRTKADPARSLAVLCEGLLAIRMPKSGNS